jgi:hypothetical protein
MRMPAPATAVTKRLDGRQRMRCVAKGLGRSTEGTKETAPHSLTIAESRLASNFLDWQPALLKHEPGRLKAQEVQILKGLGAKHIVNSTDANFRNELISALKATGATLAFDAIGGGKPAGQILNEGGYASRERIDKAVQRFIWKRAVDVAVLCRGIAVGFPDGIRTPCNSMG